MADKEEAGVIKGLLPLVGVGTAVIVVFAVSVRVFALERRAHYQDGQYLVSVRYPGQRFDLREFVQPDNPDVLAVYSQYGPDPWGLYDFVCRDIDYRRDLGEFWKFPSEVLQSISMAADCEDTAILLTSLIRAGGTPDCYVALGSLGGLGHAWCELNGEILETTYTRARPVSDPEDYRTLVLFNESEVVELWPGALDEVFSLQRNEAAKLNLMARALEA